MSTHIINFPGADIHTTTITSVSNVSVGENLDVHGTANVGVLSATLPLATVASNLVTYDTATGQLLDSNGLVSNKLSIVSEQPPAALTGDSTVVDGHGRYKVTTSLEASGFKGYKVFDKTVGVNTNGWSTGAVGAYNNDGTYAGSNTLASVNGEWVKIEFPYKTTLRHVALAPRDTSSYSAMPEDFSIVASNDDSTWVVLKSVDGQSWSSIDDVNFVVDASTAYKYYAIVVELTNNNFAQIGEWKLFAESFSVNEGVVELRGMESGPMELPAQPLTDYCTYIEGYGSFKVSNPTTGLYGAAYSAINLFDYDTSTSSRFISMNHYSNGPYNTAFKEHTTTVGGTRYDGFWAQIEFPQAFTLSHSNIYPTDTLEGRAPHGGAILGSNDGENWYTLTEFTLSWSSAEWKRIDVNAATPYSHYRMAVTDIATSGTDGFMEFTQWRLFAEKPVTRMENVHISGDLSSETLQTGYIKWPKVALKAAESEGYVASESSSFNNNFIGFHAFEDKSEYTDGGAPSWASGSTSFSSGSAAVSRTTGSDTFNHEWLQIQLPQAIQLSYFNIIRRDTDSNRVNEAPKSGRMYGSNDGVTWTKLVSCSDLTYTDYTPTRVDVNSTTSYKYFRLAVTTTTYTSGAVAYTAINELQLFEAATGVGAAPTSAKLQVAGSLGMAKGSEFFAGDDVVMELPKHDRPLVKYPEVVMTASAENVSGYEGYTVQYSGRYDSSFSAWTLFGEEFTGSNDEATSGAWVESPNTTYAKEAADAYNGVVGSVLTTVQNAETLRLASNTPIGAWISLELPNSIKLAHIDMRPRLQHASETNLNNVALQAYPRDFGIWGYNGGVWVLLKTVTNHKHTGTAFTYDRISVDSGVVYNKYAIVITRTNAVGGSNANDRNFAAIGQLYFYGYEEGDTSVDVVHRSIPNKPGQQHLEVYWDANDSNSYSFADSSNVYDLSGNGRMGTLTNGVGFDSEYNAFTFDGVNDYISGTLSNPAGEWVHSVSYWLKPDAATLDDAGNHYAFNIGAVSTTKMSGGGVSNKSPSSIFYASVLVASDYTFVQDAWTHLVIEYTGGYHTSSNVNFYINGEAYNGSFSTSGSSPGTTALNLNANTPLNLGYNGSSERYSGSIANFRLFGKALNADQVRELYEYDAERFGHRQNLVSLHKGNLGVGVAHPTSRFEVAGTETLQEYPPKAMTGYETYIEGHGVFRASQSIPYPLANYTAWKVFDKSLAYGAHWLDSYSSTADYIYDGAGTRSDGLGGIAGDWVMLEMPYAINLKSFAIAPASLARAPEDFVILGSNDGTLWTQLINYTGLGSSDWPYSGGQYILKHFDVPSTKHYYKYFAIVVTRTESNDYLQIDAMEYYGTPAPSGLEDGHMTLGKALTLPRVSGHPAGAETPRAESLVVHYDTTVDSVVSGSTVVDVSGNGINGTLTNGAAYSSTDRALTFDGTDDHIGSTLNNPSGAWVHSVSFWMKPSQDQSTLGATYENVFQIGNAGANGQYSGFEYYNNYAHWYFYGPRTNFSGNIFSANKWVHIALATDGTTVSIYLDGALKVSDSPFSSTTLNLAANAYLHIGKDGTRNRAPWGGSISNFKIWGGVALTAEEVAMEYALGRTGKSLNLTDTSLCLGGTVPRAQLDVRGGARFDGRVGIGNQPDNADDGNAYPGTFPASSIHIHHNTTGEDTESEGIRFSHPANVGRWNLFVSSNNHFRIAYNGVSRGYVDQTDNNAQMNFTGQHRTFIKDTPFTRAEELEGLIVSADNNKYIKMSGGIEAGSNAITTNESLPVVSLSTKVNDKKCFGVISASEDPEQRSDAYGSFVTPFEKELGDTRVYINSVGEGAMWVVNTAGALESGDYITTSNVAGYGQKQESDSLKNYTVAKITMDCDFNPQDQPIQRIKQSNVVETHYTGLVPVVKGVPHEFVTTTVTADDEWSNVSVSPPDVTYAEWSNLEANVQNTYTLTYTQTSNVVYDVKYTKTTTANVTAEDAWDAVHIEPPSVTYAEYSNLEANAQNTYSLTYTMTTKVEATEAIYSNLSTEDKEFFVPTYYQMVEQTVDAEYPGAVKYETVTDRLENVLDEHGQLQWEDDPSGATEKTYKIRYLDTDGNITDEANAVHTAAFVGVTYHCG